MSKINDWRTSGLATVAAITLAIMLGAVPADAQQTLKIGGIGTLTGAGSGWGVAGPRGTQNARDEDIGQGGL